MNYINISVRGRVAFLILCFERVLFKIKCLNPKLDWILENLWTYTSCAFFDDWHELMAESRPSVVLSYSSFSDDFEILTRDNFLKLYKVYSSMDEKVLEILEGIIDTGSVELFGGLNDGGRRTLSKFEKTLSIVKGFDIQLPDIANFEKFSFTDNGGWGYPFSKDDIILISDK